LGVWVGAGAAKHVRRQRNRIPRGDVPLVREATVGASDPIENGPICDRLEALFELPNVHHRFLSLCCETQMTAFSVYTPNTSMRVFMISPSVAYAFTDSRM